MEVFLIRENSSIQPDLQPFARFYQSQNGTQSLWNSPEVALAANFFTIPFKFDEIIFEESLKKFDEGTTARRKIFSSIQIVGDRCVNRHRNIIFLSI
jgi:hypothetical protein